MQIQELLDVVMQHASRCSSIKVPQCPYPNCLEVKKLFSHAKRCTIRKSGGCRSCIKVWEGIHFHSSRCQDPECRIPRCKYVTSSFFSNTKVNFWPNFVHKCLYLFLNVCVNFAGMWRRMKNGKQCNLNLAAELQLGKAMVQRLIIETFVCCTFNRNSFCTVKSNI